MQLSIHEDREVASLRKVNKILKYFFIALSILAIIPLVLTIVYANKKMEKQQQILERRGVLIALQQELEDQKFIYQFSDMNITTFQIALEKNTTTKPIRVIELQQNSLEQFSYNVIPGVQTLILDNNPLNMFSGNYFPDLNNLSIMTGEINEFSNNHLILIDTLRMNQNIDKFDNNTLALTNLRLNNTHSFSKNNLNQLQSLSLLQTPGCNMSNNNLPSLTQFQMNEQDSLNESFTNTIANNNFGRLQVWNITSYNQYQAWIFTNNSFPSLRQFIMINKTNVFSISNNLFPELEQFVLLGSHPKLFVSLLNMSNNSIPKLSTLVINQYLQLSTFTNNDLSGTHQLDVAYNTIKVFSNNTFKELQYANLSYNTYLNQLDLTAPRLLKLNMSGLKSLAELTGLDTPSLIALNITENGFGVVNVTLPSLQYLDATHGGIIDINIHNGSKIAEAILAKNRIKEFDQEWNSLITLDLSENKLKYLNVSAYTHLQTLLVSKNGLTTIDLGNLSHLQTLDLSDNSFTYFDSRLYQSLPNLKSLSLFNNSLTDISLKAPNLDYLNISYNKPLKVLGKLEIPSLTKLDINFCSISQVSGLKFERLQILQLYGNPITIFSNNTFNISSMNTAALSQLESFENNQIDGYDTALQNPVLFTMTSASLSKFENNDLILGNIEFKGITQSLRSISKNDLTVPNGDLTIKSPNLKSFTENNVRFCSTFLIANNSLTSFENNTIFNVTTVSIYNTSLNTLNKNNIIKGAKSLILEKNFLTDGVAQEIAEMGLIGIQYISLRDNKILNHTLAQEILQKAYPEAIVKV